MNDYNNVYDLFIIKKKTNLKHNVLFILMKYLLTYV